LKPTRRAAWLAPALLAAACAGDAGGPVEIPLPDMEGAEPVVREAVEAVREAVRADPRSAEAWGRLGHRLGAHQWSAEAGDCYARAEALDRRDFRWPYFLALTRLRTEPEAAAEALARAIRLDDSYAPAHVYYGQTLVRLGRSEEAREHFERATALDSENSHAEVGLGQIALSEGRFEEARRHLEEALLRNADHQEAHQALAQALAALGEHEAAEGHVRASQSLPTRTFMQDRLLAERRLEPIGSRAMNEAGKALLDVGRVDEAIRYFQRSIELKPDAAEPRYHIGSALARKGRVEEALAYLREAVELRPNLAVAHVNLAIVLARVGRLAEAETHFEEALRTKPDDAVTLYNLGSLLATQGRLDEAEKPLRRAAELSPGDAETRFALGSLHEARGDGAAALAAYRDAVELRPGWSAPAQRMVWLFAADPDPAVRDAAAARQLAEMWCRATGFADPGALDALAAAHAEGGRFDEAVGAATRALQAARAGGHADLAGEIERRLSLYRQRRPYRSR
jgi:tetratricopeptide (TPR) repeat protein